MLPRPAEAKRSPGNAGRAAFERKRETNQDFQGKPFRCRGWEWGGALTSPSPAPQDLRSVGGLGTVRSPGLSQLRRTAPKRPRGSSRGAEASRAALGAAIPRLGPSCQPPQDPLWRSRTRLACAPGEGTGGPGREPGTRGSSFTGRLRCASSLSRTSGDVVEPHFTDENAEAQEGKCPAQAKSGREADSGPSAPSLSL